MKFEHCSKEAETPIIKSSNLHGNYTPFPRNINETIRVVLRHYNTCLKFTPPPIYINGINSYFVITIFAWKLWPSKQTWMESVVFVITIFAWIFHPLPTNVNWISRIHHYNICMDMSRSPDKREWIQSYSSLQYLHEYYTLYPETWMESVVFVISVLHEIPHPHSIKMNGINRI